MLASVIRVYLYFIYISDIDKAFQSRLFDSTSVKFEKILYLFS